eukprot:92556_1
MSNLMETENNENDTDVQCICGKLLIPIKAEYCYGNSRGVVCNQCGESRKSSSIVYHCPNGKTRLHPHGYDLCNNKCALDIMDHRTKIMATNKVKSNRKITIGRLLGTVLALYCISIIVTISLGIVDSYQSGHIEYQYTITTPNRTAIFPLKNTFDCGLNKIKIGCSGSLNAGNLHGHDICDLLTTRNNNNEYVINRLDANPQYNSSNGYTFWMIIVFGLQIPFAIVLLISFFVFKLQQSKKSLTLWIPLLIISSIIMRFAMHYGMEMISGDQICTNGLQEYIQNQIGNDIWNNGYEWKPYNRFKNIVTTWIIWVVDGGIVLICICIIIVDVLCTSANYRHQFNRNKFAEKMLIEIQNQNIKTDAKKSDKKKKTELSEEECRSYVEYQKWDFEIIIVAVESTIYIFYSIVWLVLLAINEYESGWINYKYTITTYENEMNNYFTCNLKNIIIDCHLYNEKNLNGYDICDLLGSGNKNYKVKRIDVNPYYNSYNGIIYLVLIAVGCHVLFIVSLEILSGTILNLDIDARKRHNKAVKFWIFILLIELIVIPIGMYYGIQMITGNQTCIIGLREYIINTIGYDVWNDGFEWESINKFKPGSTWGMLVADATIIFVWVLLRLGYSGYCRKREEFETHEWMLGKMNYKNYYGAQTVDNELDVSN